MTLCCFGRLSIGRALSSESVQRVPRCDSYFQSYFQQPLRNLISGCECTCVGLFLKNPRQDVQLNVCALPGFVFSELTMHAPSGNSVMDAPMFCRERSAFFGCVHDQAMKSTEQKKKKTYEFSAEHAQKWRSTNPTSDSMSVPALRSFLQYGLYSIFDHCHGPQAQKLNEKKT